MSHDDRFIGQLEDYLEEFDGVTPLPDRVRDAIRAELPSARQVRPKPGLRRMFTMLSFASAGARVGLAAAAIIVAVVLGAAFLYSNRNVEGVGAPAPADADPDHAWRRRRPRPATRPTRRSRASPRGRTS